MKKEKRIKKIEKGNKGKHKTKNEKRKKEEKRKEKYVLYIILKSANWPQRRASKHKIPLEPKKTKTTNCNKIHFYN